MLSKKQFLVLIILTCSFSFVGGASITFFQSSALAENNTSKRIDTDELFCKTIVAKEIFLGVNQRFTIGLLANEEGASINFYDQKKEDRETIWMGVNERGASMGFDHGGTFLIKDTNEKNLITLSSDFMGQMGLSILNENDEQIQVGFKNNPQIGPGIFMGSKTDSVFLGALPGIEAGAAIKRNGRVVWSAP